MKTFPAITTWVVVDAPAPVIETATKSIIKKEDIGKRTQKQQQKRGWWGFSAWVIGDDYIAEQNLVSLIQFRSEE